MSFFLCQGSQHFPLAGPFQDCSYCGRTDRVATRLSHQEIDQADSQPRPWGRQPSSCDFQWHFHWDLALFGEFGDVKQSSGLSFFVALSILALDHRLGHRFHVQLVTSSEMWTPLVHLDIYIYTYLSPSLSLWIYLFVHLFIDLFIYWC